MDARLASALQKLLNWQLQGPLCTFTPARVLDLRVATLDHEEDAFDPGGGAELGEHFSNPEPSRFSVRTKALLRRPERRVLVSGVSGAGKTFALGRLAHELSLEGLSLLAGGNDPEWIPLWELASELPESDFTPVEWLSRLFQLRTGIFMDSQHLAGALLESSRLLLLIDSIHEVIGISLGRTRNLKMLSSLPGVRIVASTRPGYELPLDGLHYDSLELQGLSPADRDRLSEQSELRPESAEALRRFALEPKLRKAAEIPQIWQMAIALASAGVDLSDVRQEVVLYERFVDSAFQKDEPSALQANAGDIQDLLEMLGGASAFRGGQEIPWAEALNLVARWSGCRGQGLSLTYDQSWPGQVLDSLPRHFHPVLRRGSGEKAIGFSHGSLADFLAARWILRICRTVPRESLELAPLADTLSFALEILEQRGVPTDVLSDLDSELLRQGSRELVISWLRRVARERIEIVVKSLLDRLRADLRNPREARRLLQTLRGRGIAWARRLIAPILADKHSRQELERLFPTRNRSSLPEVTLNFAGSRSRKSKDLPQLEGPVVSRKDLRYELTSRDPARRAAAARTLGLIGDLCSVDQLILMLGLENEPDAEVRGRVATALGRLGDSAAVPSLGLRVNHTTEPSSEVRGKAARALGYLGDQRGVSPLLVCLRQEKSDIVRGSAITALGAIGETRVLPLLLGILNPQEERDPKNRGAAATALGQLSDPRAVPTLLKSLDSQKEPDAAVRGSAATALGQLGDLRAVPPLLDSLDPQKETDAAVRGSAATALGQLGDLRAVAPLLDSLDPQKETSANVRGSAATALGQLGDLRAVASLLDNLDPQKEPDAAVRGSAATALGQLGDLRAVAPLLDNLDPQKEPDAATRGSAATALGQLGDPRAVATLLDRLNPQKESGVDVRGSAATALGQLGDLRAVAPLLDNLDPQKEPDAAVRGSAATALGQLGDLRAVAPLLDSLDPQKETSANVRGSAATALGQLGDLRAVAPLLDSLDPQKETSANVRGSAATALGQLGDLRAVATLLDRLNPQKEPNARVRGSVASALGQLGDPRAVTALLNSLDPRKEAVAAVRGSVAKALGLIGAAETEEPLLWRLRLPNRGGEPDFGVRNAINAALRSLSLSMRDSTNPDEMEALKQRWKDLLEDFYFQTQSPSPQYFAQLLALSLRAIERHAGGGVSRNWKEKDFERLLATLLGRDEAIQVIAQAEPADRQRLDLLLLTRDRARVVIELKLGASEEIDRFVPQLQSYIESLSTDGAPVAGHLVLFDITEIPTWTESERHSERDGIQIWRAHVNRQPPSSLARPPETKRPSVL